MINSKINKEIALLWHEYFDKYELGKTPVSVEEFDKVKAPMFYDEPKQGGILFIGMNPSFTPKANRILKKKYPEIINPSEYYLWNNIKNSEEKINRMIEIERMWPAEYHSFFKKIRDISENTGLQFQHIDLFVYRETNQSQFIKKIEPKGKLNKFGVDQMKIFDKVLSSLDPRVIVIANAKASEIFRSQYADSLRFINDRGYHLFKDQTPIFFSSMLSGMRALDKGSFERLVWHIKKSILR